MKRFVCLILTIALLFTIVVPAMAKTIEERQYVSDLVNQLVINNKMSSDELYGVCVDLSLISKQTVTATVYKTVYQNTTTITYTDIKPQPILGANGAKDKLLRFFHFFDNNNPDIMTISLGSTPDEIVQGFVYGERKAEIINAFVAGIPECLERQRLYDNPTGGSSGGSSSTPAKPSTPEQKEENPDEWANKYLTTVFTINSTSYSVVTTQTTDKENTDTEVIEPKLKQMDVSPYIKNDRTYLPVRYLAYSLGVAEDGVTWDGTTRKVGITKDNTDISLIIGSQYMYVNKKPVKMDVAPEITNNRTFLPARWVAEALGAIVEWDDATKQTIIKIPIKEEQGN